jgi:hypothetical protein
MRPRVDGKRLSSSIKLEFEWQSQRHRSSCWRAKKGGHLDQVAPHVFPWKQRSAAGIFLAVVVLLLAGDTRSRYGRHLLRWLRLREHIARSAPDIAPIVG